MPSSPRSLSRRQFLATAGGTAGVLALAPGCATPSGWEAPAPLVGTQLYGWGQYYHREGKELDAHLDEVLAAVRDCGFAYAEASLDAARPENNARFAARLRSKGLVPVSLYTGGRFHESGAASQTVDALLGAARVCRDAGFQIIVCNPDPIGRDKTDAELVTQAAALNQLGRGLRAMGLQLGLHHHTPEMRGGAREFHSNFQRSEAGTVDFCYDVHWVFRGGVMPADCLRQYGQRIVSWHLRQSRDRIWWEDLAPGDVDYQEIARTARRRRLPARYTVELALENGTRVTRTVVENHRRSREFIRQVFGV